MITIGKLSINVLVLVLLINPLFNAFGDVNAHGQELTVEDAPDIFKTMTKDEMIIAIAELNSQISVMKTDLSNAENTNDNRYSVKIDTVPNVVGF